MKNVMTRAWEIAKEGVAKFGGKVKEYFAQALVMAWKEVKNSLQALAQKIEKDAFNEEFAVIKANIWEKYGKRRIYFNDRMGDRLGYFEFDADNNYVKGYVQYEMHAHKESNFLRSCKNLLAGGYSL